MTEFNPPIETRETEDLLLIALGSLDAWQQEAIDLAKDELKKRGISEEQQKRIFDKWSEELRQSELAHQKQLDLNVAESYSIGKMIYIFLVAPFILLGKWRVDLSLSELKLENYSKKYKQRLIMLICGATFWLVIFRLMTIR